MRIDILTPLHYTRLNIEAQRGHANSGGGMSCLINAARATLSSRYQVNVCTEISELQSDVVIVDALFIAIRVVKDTHFKTVAEQSIAELQKDKENNPCRKYLLWCAEMSAFRWLPAERRAITALVDGIAVTDPYIWQLFKVVGVTPLGYLCDAINPDLFRPVAKEMTVTAVGALKHIKNIDWIIKVFRQLEGKMKRTYLGSAVLWSHEKRSEDRALVSKIEAVTEEYYPNASPIEVAYHNARAAFAVNDTWHDCSSRSNEELLMSGVISIHGRHPLFNPRPGFRVKTPNEAAAKIAELTENFTQLPDPRLHEQSRQWALENVSTHKFMEQFENLSTTFSIIRKHTTRLR